MMTVGVTFDHRFMDGYYGGAMAQVFRAYMENPAAFEDPGHPAARELTGLASRQN
jgi:hypothetical protein